MAYSDRTKMLRRDRCTTVITTCLIVGHDLKQID